MRMAIKLDKLTGFYLDPPGLQNLVKEHKDGRKGRQNSILVILPSYHDGFRLRRYLDRLKGQESKNFDVIVILAADDEFIDEPDLPIYQVKRKMDFGFAGSVYLGQLFAYENGYEYYIFADMDRVPCQESSIGDLHGAIKSKNHERAYGNMLCEGIYLPGEKIVGIENPKTIIAKGSNTVFFNLIKTSTLEKTGLYFLPWYMGFEETDYIYRLRGLDEAYVNKDIWSFLEKTPIHGVVKTFQEKKFADSTYLYATMQGYRLCPVSLRQMPFATIIKTTLSVCYIFELLKRRIPGEIKAMEASMENGEFCKVGYEFDEPLLAPVEGKGQGEYKASGNGKALSLIGTLFSEKGAIARGSGVFEVFAYNSFDYSESMEGENARRYAWKKRLAFHDKSIALLNALCRAAGIAFAAYSFNILKKKYITEGYGAALLGKHAEKRPLHAAQGKGDVFHGR